MKKVQIAPGCISCGLCEFIAPEVFVVTDVCRVKDNAPLAGHEEKIKNAAQSCPVGVIHYEKKEEE